MGLWGLIVDGCWHHFYGTGRYGKKAIDPKDPRKREVTLMVEGACCRCGKTKWIEHYTSGDHGATNTYSTDCYPELPYV